MIFVQKCGDLDEKDRGLDEKDEGAKECIYLAYMGNALEDGPEKFDEFLKRWIAHLGAAKGRSAGVDGGSLGQGTVYGEV